MEEKALKTKNKSKHIVENERDVFDKIFERAAQTPEKELNKLPRDGSINYKHYLYGNPKK